jgi:hypothetical protein
MGRVEAIAQAHLSCGFPSKHCDPIHAATAAGLSDRETAALVVAIEGYHDPIVRVLAARSTAYLASLITRADCDSCGGTGWLVTSSFDEGFPCPTCAVPVAPSDGGEG